VASFWLANDSVAPSLGNGVVAAQHFRHKHGILERLKKYCSHAERGFLSFGKASAKEHARSGL
jgi:hypothetical protein